MRGFRIWPQNSNRITFNPLFGPRTVKYWENNRFRQNIIFDSFFGQKGVKCYLIWILRPDSESSRHLAYLSPHLIWFSDFDFLTSPCIFKIFKSHEPHGFCKLPIFFHIFGIRIVLCKGISLGKVVLWLTTHLTAGPRLTCWLGGHVLIAHPVTATAHPVRLCADLPPSEPTMSSLLPSLETSSSFSPLDSGAASDQLKLRSLEASRDAPGVPAWSHPSVAASIPA